MFWRHGEDEAHHRLLQGGWQHLLSQNRSITVQGYLINLRRFPSPTISRVALDRQASMRKILEILSKSKHLLLWGHACMMESTTQKNKGKKSSLLMRFKLVMGIDDSIIPKRNGSDPVLSYLAVAYNDGAVLPAMLSSLFGAAHALKTVISATTLVVFFFLPQWDSSLCWKKYTHLV